jgi:lysophospholipase L1-like esterase
VKKKTTLFICILIIILLISLLSSCQTTNVGNQRIDNSSIKIIALGDSIAEGKIGVSPESERNNYSYLEVVGKINGFSYQNLAIAGYKTSDLLNYVLQKNESAAPIKAIKEATIIVVSILGNDLLENDFTTYFVQAISKPASYDSYDQVLTQSYSNIEAIVERIKVLNKDAYLIFQTLYNPMYPGSSKLMTPSFKQSVREYYPDTTEEDFYDMTALLIDRLNNVLHNYLKANPNAFKILDVNKRFDTLHKASSGKLNRLICDDDGHPSNEGHAAIACLLQEHLENAKLAKHSYAFANFKSLRKKQLTRLYSNTTVDINKTSNLIDSASTYQKLNDAYFDAIDGIAPSL